MAISDDYISGRQILEEDNKIKESFQLFTLIVDTGLQPYGAYSDDPIPPPDVPKCKDLIEQKERELKKIHVPTSIFYTQKDGTLALLPGCSTSNLEIAKRREYNEFEKYKALCKPVTKEIKGLSDYLEYCKKRGGEDLISWKGFVWKQCPKAMGFDARFMEGNIKRLSSPDVKYLRNEFERCLRGNQDKPEKKNTENSSREYLERLFKEGFKPQTWDEVLSHPEIKGVMGHMNSKRKKRDYLRPIVMKYAPQVCQPGRRPKTALPPR